jgi:hypothetical protein
MAVAVARLSNRLKAARPRRDPVGGASAANRLAPLLRPASATQALAAIATTAETKLNSTPLAAREPVFRRRQETPCRRFLDMEL